MWTKALSDVLFGRHEHCRLCFCEADEDDICFNDEVLLNLKNEKISDMLTYILGGKFTSEMNMGDRFCGTCILSVKNTYNFIKMCKDKSNTYINIIETLNDSLKKTEGVGRTKSVLIHIDSKDYSFMQFYQYREESVKVPARRKLRDSNSKYLKGKIKKPKNQHDKFKRHNMKSESEKGLLNSQCNEGNELVHIPENNLEHQHFNLKAVIEKAVSKRSGSRKHILKSNTIKNKTAFLKPSVPQRQYQTDLTNPQTNSLHNEIVNESFCDDRVNIIRKKRKVKKPFIYEFPCEDCGRTFCTQYRLKVHTEHQSCKYVCKDCILTFPDVKELREHNRKEHMEKAFMKCNICNITYNTESIADHRKKHFDPKSSLFIPRND